MPTVQTSVRSEFLRQRVSVRRDGRGVPYIDAAEDSDAYFVQGYVTASDRLWQMDLFRRTARGELAEILGEPILDQDKHYRIYGFSSVAARTVARTDPVLRAAYASYAAGVNACIAAFGGDPPLEFKLLDYQPSPWTPEDCVIVGKLTSEALGTNWPNDMMRALFVTLPAATLTQLFRETSPLDTVLVGSDAIPSAMQMKAVVSASMAQEVLVQPSLLPELIAKKRRRAEALRRVGLYSRGRAASNNWVVSGAHTDSGRPLLANDPHLSPSAPSLWYMTHLRTPNYAAAGVTIPGIPGIMLGHNERIAWGATNMSADAQEVCKETIDPQNPDRYLTPDGWQTITKRNEAIKVRRGTTGHDYDIVDFECRATRNGPLVIDHTDQSYSLRWFALEDTADEYGAFYWLDRACDWQTFREGLRHYKGTPQNFVYADTAGNVGYQGAGLAPARVNVGIPVDGAKIPAGDTPFLSLNDMPELYNPPSGLIATANNRIIGLDFPYRLTHDWSVPYRSRRIVERLDGGDDHTVESSLHIQGDTYSYADAIFTSEAVKLARPRAAAGDPAWTEIYDTFKGWDARSSADSTVMSIAASMRDAFSRRVLVAALGQDRADTYSRWPGSPSFIDFVIDTRRSEWLPQGTASYEDLFLASYNDAIKKLTSQLGSDRAKWTWSRVADPIVFGHPLAAMPGAGQSFAIPPIPQNTGGGGDTVNAGAFVSMRLVADLADWDNTRQGIPLGQSGDPSSPHWKDQLANWEAVAPAPFPFTRAAVERAAVTVTHFAPPDQNAGGHT
jgi:penicillin amidase